MGKRKAQKAPSAFSRVADDEKRSEKVPTDPEAVLWYCERGSWFRMISNQNQNFGKQFSPWQMFLFISLLLIMVSVPFIESYFQNLMEASHALRKSPLGLVR